MATIINCPEKSLPRSLDVVINISRPQSEVATDMTLLAFLTPIPSWAPNVNRVRYYSTMQAVEEDHTTGSPAWRACNAFFARQIHPERIAVGAVFTEPQSAGLVAATQMSITQRDALKQIENGSFEISVGGIVRVVSGIDFSAVVSPDDVAIALNSESEAEVGTFSIGYGGRLYLKGQGTGSASKLSYMRPVQGGEADFVGDLLMMTQDAGAELWDGYTPGTIVDEAKLIAEASSCNGRKIYGWTLDAIYRDTEAQKSFADWAESREPAYFSACTNNASAYDTSDVTNIGYYTHNRGYRRTSIIYHDNALVYPDVSYAALALATDYRRPDSAITMKFKMLEGISTSGLTETQVTALGARNINCYTLIGNQARTVREGTNSADSWFTDTVVNLDNFREELQVEVYNVFLRNPKVPYTTAGQNKLISAAKFICDKYTRNGVFAPRTIEDTTLETGFTVVPATQITPVSVAYATVSERALRIAPPIQIVAYESGAIHKVTINVDVFN
jgi:hypothetical protein